MQADISGFFVGSFIGCIAAFSVQAEEAKPEQRMPEKFVIEVSPSAAADIMSGLIARQRLIGEVLQDVQRQIIIQRQNVEKPKSQ